MIEEVFLLLLRYDSKTSYRDLFLFTKRTKWISVKNNDNNFTRDDL